MFPVLSLSLSLVKDKHAEMMENRGPPFFCSWFCFMCSVKTDRGTKKKKKGLKTDLRRPVLSACPVLLLSATRPQSYSPTSIWDGHCATFFLFASSRDRLEGVIFFIVWILDGHRKTKDGARTRTFFFLADEVFQRFPFCCFIVLLRLFSFFCSYRPWETTRTVLTPPFKRKTTLA